MDEATTADWTPEEVDREINSGYQEVVTSVMEIYEEFYVTTTTFDSKEDQQEYGTSDDFPTDFFKMRRVEINFDTSNSNSIPRRAKPVSIDSVLRDLGNSALGISIYRNPAYYLIGSGSGIKLGFIPIPARDGTNAIKIWYIPVQTDLSDSTNSPNIPYEDRYSKLISLYASATLLRKGQQEEVAARQYLLDFEEGLAKMRAQLEDRVADDAKAIIDTMQFDTDFTNYSTI